MEQPSFKALYGPRVAGGELTAAREGELARTQILLSLIREDTGMEINVTKTYKTVGTFIKLRDRCSRAKFEPANVAGAEPSQASLTLRYRIFKSGKLVCKRIGIYRIGIQ